MLEAFNYPIATLREGLNAIVDDDAKALPLKDMAFKIEIENGLAVIRTTRIPLCTTPNVTHLRPEESCPRSFDF